MSWPQVPIRRLCDATGTTDPRREPDVSFRYIDISGIDRDMKRIAKTVDILGADAPSRARQVVQTSDVLVSTVRPNLNAVAIVPEELDGEIASTGFCVLRARKQLLLPRYLFFFTRTEPFVASLLHHVRGANYPAVTDRNVLDGRIPWPPLSEQRRIVEILDQADELRRLRSEADAKADRILPALYRKMFLASSEQWPKEPLGTHLRKRKGALQSGPFGSHLHNSDFVEDGPIRVVGIDNVLDGEFSQGRDRKITDEKYRELERFTLEPGDVLITIMGTIGRTCVFPSLDEPAICTKHVYRIQVDDQLDPQYLSASIRFSPTVRSQLGGSTTGQIVAGITSEGIRQLELLVPPIELQKGFARASSALSAQREVWRHAGQRLERLFSNLLHCAFSGDLTASWREAHMKELLQEMEQQARLLGGSSTEVNA